MITHPDDYTDPLPMAPLTGPTQAIDGLLLLPFHQREQMNLEGAHLGSETAQSEEINYTGEDALDKILAAQDPIRNALKALSPGLRFMSRRLIRTFDKNWNEGMRALERPKGWHLKERMMEPMQATLESNYGKKFIFPEDELTQIVTAGGGHFNGSHVHFSHTERGIILNAQGAEGHIQIQLQDPETAWVRVRSPKGDRALWRVNREDFALPTVQSSEGILLIKQDGKWYMGSNVEKGHGQSPVIIRAPYYILKHVA